MLEIKLRWFFDSWTEYADGLPAGVYRTEKPVLQYWNGKEWIDVPTEYEDEE